MKDAYHDIRSRIDEPPLWWNRYGVPRYEEPGVPEHLLGAVGCQSCGRCFIVAPIEPIYVRNPFATKGNVVVKEGAELDHKGKSHLRLRDDWGYGDPPRHGCVGDSMTAVPQYRWDKDYYPESLFPSSDTPWEEVKRVARAQSVEEHSDGWTSETPEEPGLWWYDAERVFGNDRMLCLVDVFWDNEHGELRGRIIWKQTNEWHKRKTLHSRPLHDFEWDGPVWMAADVPHPLINPEQQNKQ